MDLYPSIVKLYKNLQRQKKRAQKASAFKILQNKLCSAPAVFISAVPARTALAVEDIGIRAALRACHGGSHIDFFGRFRRIGGLLRYKRKLRLHWRYVVNRHCVCAA